MHDNVMNLLWYDLRNLRRKEELIGDTDQSELCFFLELFVCLVENLPIK